MHEERNVLPEDDNLEDVFEINPNGGCFGTKILNFEMDPGDDPALREQLHQVSHFAVKSTS